MILNSLKHLVNSLPHAQPVDEVDQVQIGQLTVQAVDLHVDVADLLAADLKIYCGLVVYNNKNKIFTKQGWEVFSANLL